MKFLLLVFLLSSGSAEIGVGELPMPDLAECQKVAADLSKAALDAAGIGLVPTVLGGSCVPSPEGYPVPTSTPATGE